jgi:hypothetical protein
VSNVPPTCSHKFPCVRPPPMLSFENITPLRKLLQVKSISHPPHPPPPPFFYFGHSFDFKRRVGRGWGNSVGPVSDSLWDRPQADGWRVSVCGRYVTHGGTVSLARPYLGTARAALQSQISTLESSSGHTVSGSSSSNSSKHIAKQLAISSEL